MPLEMHGRTRREPFAKYDGSPLPRGESGVDEIETFLYQDLSTSTQIDSTCEQKLVDELQQYFHVVHTETAQPKPVPTPGLPMWSVPIKRNWVSSAASLEALSHDIGSIE